MRNYIASLLVSVSFIGSAFASEELNVTHNVLVREGFSVDSCAREIERQTTAEVVQVMEAVSVISVNANARDATRIAKLRCVDTVEKNGTVKQTKLGESSEHLMSYEQAKLYCSERGARIPTARELAEYAISLGATGIRETKYPGEHISSDEVRDERNRNEAEGFEVVTKKIINSHGYPYSTVAFYYSRNGFNSKDPYYTEKLWSSDLAYSGLTYYLSEWGHLWEKNQYFSVARVRCIE
nr:hypothetical protein HAGR004_40950 [Bdellovibrio sp. HAGR004]